MSEIPWTASKIGRKHSTDHMIVKCSTGQVTRYSTKGDVNPYDIANGHVKCPVCGKTGYHKKGVIEGKLNDSVPCNKKCTAAKGYDCECSCAGENHGKDNDGVNIH